MTLTLTHANSLLRGDSLPELPEPTENRSALFTITAELLAEAMRLPPGTKITSIAVSRDCHDSFDVIVEHPDLQQVRPGEAIPRAYPQFRVEHIAKVHFDGWGQR